MKRILIPLLALFLAIPLAAQEKFEVRIGWGGYPLMDEGNFTDSYRNGEPLDYCHLNCAKGMQIIAKTSR